MSSIAQVLDEALRAHRRGDLDAAAQCYEEILTQNPSNANALNLLGTLRSQQGRHDEGIGLLRRAVEVDDRQSLVHFNLGNALRSAGSLEAAIDAYRATLAIEPRHGAALAAMGACMRRVGRIDDAMQTLRRAHEVDPQNVQVISEFAQTLMRAGRPEEALPLLHRLASEDLDRIDHLELLGRALLEMHRPRLAARPLRRAVRLAPDRPVIRNLYGSALLAIGDAHHALEQFDAACEARPSNSEFHMNRGLALRRLRRFPAARAAFERSCELDPNAIEPAFNLALTLEIVGSFEASGRVAHRAHAIDPDHLQLGFLLARLDRRAGREREAEQRLVDVLERTPNRQGRASALYELALLHDQAGRHDRAFQAAAEANRLNSESGPARQIMWTTSLTELEEIAARLRRRSDETDSSREKSVGRAPVFVLGYPYSDLIALTRWLAGSNLLRVMHDTPVITSLIMQLQADGARPSHGQIVPGSLTGEEAERVRRSYLATVASRFPSLPTEAAVLDVRPENLFHIDFVLDIFPDARFLWIQPEPAGVCLNWFMQQQPIDEHSVHFFHMETAARYLGALRRAWRALRAIRPESCMELVFTERLMSRSELASQLGAFLGVELPMGEEVVDVRGPFDPAHYAEPLSAIMAQLMGHEAAN